MTKRMYGQASAGTNHSSKKDSSAQQTASVNPFTSFLTAKGHPTTPVTTHVHSLWTETVRKQNRNFRLNENFHVTPRGVRDIVPNERPGSYTRQKPDEECLRSIHRSYQAPRAKYPRPVTTSQSYGWDASPLVKEQCPFFHRPRRSTMITQLYGSALR
ncbi:FAM183A and FAM183B related-domain-containing protein [Phlyctochytrium arcticum]|nr:FAM183A and FAM183B related-domain-containing protein [Phlyctochytrium arcticum]